MFVTDAVILDNSGLDMCSWRQQKQSNNHFVVTFQNAEGCDRVVTMGH